MGEEKCGGNGYVRDMMDPDPPRSFRTMGEMRKRRRIPPPPTSEMWILEEGSAFYRITAKLVVALGFRFGAAAFAGTGMSAVGFPGRKDTEKRVLAFEEGEGGGR